ncbi:hypothetical protein UCRPA7_5242 [Phaeoacremonium minimum UCRPA7]|uniref:BTB domain-containing protein n=1 Tax=Phaeoacremonium minimum (strain UCR-PA7) TaxID=1286976 RepID=R8BIU9_PHAM7|nr:hypothetical protein UCRPA7_5242 [Phaeoacremonium minimum UCRPA7]EON99241.1 hypothetical protein UCRPA7_5242 [Phaeoacremonium minimum UCRPA7]
MFAPPVTMSYAPEHMAAAPVDEYGRPILTAGPLDNYGRGTNNYGPSTPHSFHDSQSSKHVDENGYGAPPFVNGLNGHDHRRYSGPTTNISARYPPVSGPPPMLDMDNREEVYRIVQVGFSNPEFADCEVHLHLSDGASSENLQPPVARRPLHVPAHRLILARSPVLRTQLLTHGTPDGKLHILSDDPYMRSDAFWFALQSLYGNPLHEIQPDPVEGSNNLEKFDMTLAYAASGSLLQVAPITVQGIRDASRLINWGTLEKGLAFALTGATILYPHGHEDPSAQFLIPQYKHGVYVHDFVAAIMAFIIDNFPPDFTLDTSVLDPKYTRTPSMPALPPSANRAEPTIAHGTSGFNPASHVRGIPGPSQMPQNPRLSNPRLSNIQFGDLSPLKSNGQGSPSQQSPTSPSDMVTSMLSRILLNLPFDLLKYVLESQGLGNVSGWMTTQDRHRVVSDVVAEREVRRLRALDAVMGGRVPNAQAVRARLQGQDSQGVGDTWDVLGWKEELSPASTDSPYMVRSWNPLHG